MEEQLLTALIIAVVLFFILRELFCWYWKINAMVTRLESIDGHLQKISVHLQSKKISEESISGEEIIEKDITIEEEKYKLNVKYLRGNQAQEKEVEGTLYCSSQYFSLEDSYSNTIFSLPTESIHEIKITDEGELILDCNEGLGPIHFELTGKSINVQRISESLNGLLRVNG
jgi:hypothetical protein